MEQRRDEVRTLMNGVLEVLWTHAEVLDEIFNRKYLQKEPGISSSSSKTPPYETKRNLPSITIHKTPTHSQPASSFPELFYHFQ